MPLYLFPDKSEPKPSKPVKKDGVYPSGRPHNKEKEEDAPANPEVKYDTPIRNPVEVALKQADWTDAPEYLRDVLKTANRLISKPFDVTSLSNQLGRTGLGSLAAGAVQGLKGLGANIVAEAAINEVGNAVAGEPQTQQEKMTRDTINRLGAGATTGAMFGGPAGSAAGVTIAGVGDMADKVITTAQDYMENKEYISKMNDQTEEIKRRLAEKRKPAEDKRAKAGMTP